MQVDTSDEFYGPLEDLRAALDASGVVGTWDWDCVRHTARYDRGAAELLADDPDLAGQTLHADAATAGIHPEDKGWMTVETTRAIAAGGLILSEYRVVSRTRGTRWLLSRGRVYQDQHGRPVRCKGILIDITDSRQETLDEGRGYIAQAGLHREDPLNRAAACCLEARGLIEVEREPSELRLLLDMALYEIGLRLARRTRS